MALGGLKVVQTGLHVSEAAHATTVVAANAGTTPAAAKSAALLIERRNNHSPAVGCADSAKRCICREMSMLEACVCTINFRVTYRPEDQVKWQLQSWLWHSEKRGNYFLGLAVGERSMAFDDTIHMQAASHEFRMTKLSMTIR